jgi:hypothetical protein
MTWSKSFTLGAVAFLAVHAVEVYRWRDWFDAAGRYQPWFLNTGPSAGAAVLVLAVAGAGASALWARNGVDAGLQALAVAAGAALAMTITLFVIGPGNIFPIVLMAGTGVAVAGAAVGGWLGFLVASGIRRSRRNANQ